MEQREWQYELEVKREAVKGVDGFKAIVREDDAEKAKQKVADSIPT
jgi:hypothetical protein